MGRQNTIGISPLRSETLAWTRAMTEGMRRRDAVVVWLQDFIIPERHSESDLVCGGLTLHVRCDFHHTSCQVSWLSADVLDFMAVSPKFLLQD